MKILVNGYGEIFLENVIGKLIGKAILGKIIELRFATPPPPVFGTWRSATDVFLEWLLSVFGLGVSKTCPKNVRPSGHRCRFRGAKFVQN